MNAVDLLIQQHREIEGMLRKALDTEEADAREQLYKQAADHLAVHVASEEQIFFPAVKAGRTEDILLESLEEHLALKRLIADLEGLQPSEKTFEPKLHVLKEQSEHHHKEEEDDLFPKVRKMMDGQRLDQLGNEMLALQKRMQRDGEPREAVAEQTDKAAPL
jgi:iron-sulfur cluster repair protein YtfE (RIC family)